MRARAVGKNCQLYNKMNYGTVESLIELIDAEITGISLFFFYFSYKWVIPFTYITEANSVPISKPLSETSGRLYYSLLL